MTFMAAPEMTAATAPPPEASGATRSINEPDMSCPASHERRRESANAGGPAWRLA